VIPAEYVSRPALAQLMEYLRSEIFRALSERRPLEERWIKQQRMYRAIPEETQKEFPFLGASNVVVPLIATDVDITVARLIGILFTPENLWSCSALRPDMVEYAPRLQEFLRWAQRKELDAYNAVADFILEMTKLGTGILKQRYKREQKKIYQFRETPQGTLEQHLQAMVSDHPVLQHVSLYDFLAPAEAIDIQTAPWVGERIALSWGQLQQRARAGIYGGIERLGFQHANYRGSELELERMRLDRFSPGIGNRYDLWEAWLDFDISASGEPCALVATLHLPTMTLLRVDFNPFFHQEKPYSMARFMRQEKRFYGIGLSEMLEQLQDEITAMHNQRIDNATLANSTMFKARKGIGVRQDEPVFPGRWFLLDNLEDVQTLQMGQRFDSTVPYEQLSQSYATNRSGVNDYVMGNATPSIGYGTATTNVLQHQEAGKRFDQTLREVRVALGESGVRLVELYQQFNQGGKIFAAMGDRDGALVQQVLQFPLELIRYGVGIDVTATSATLNKDIAIRNQTIVMQMTTQFYMQMLQGMQMLLNPQLPPELRAMVMQMMQGGNVLMRRLLDTYDVQDIDNLVPKLQELLNGGQQQLDSVSQPFGAGAIGSAAAPGAPRMEVAAAMASGQGGFGGQSFGGGY
jgi:hypothetical protein